MSPQSTRSTFPKIHVRDCVLSPMQSRRRFDVFTRVMWNATRERNKRTRPHVRQKKKLATTPAMYQQSVRCISGDIGDKMNSDKSNGANEKSRAIDIALVHVCNDHGWATEERRVRRAVQGSDSGRRGRGIDGSTVNIKQTTLLTLWIRLFALAACAAVLSLFLSFPRPSTADRCTMRRRRKGGAGVT